MTAGLLEIGLNGALHIREERLSMRHDTCRLMYVSDIHLRRRRSDNLCLQVIESVRRSKADAVLLGGDLVDTPSELRKLCDLVAALRELAPVLAARMASCASTIAWRCRNDWLSCSASLAEKIRWRTSAYSGGTAMATARPL